MNREILKSVIYDQHDIIRSARITPRRYSFEENANYILTGLRRAGKSTLLYSRVKHLVDQGVAWNRIIYINFEDERLTDFTLSDFNDILLAQSELSSEEGFFFFDEIQNIDGWEKFARRLADSGKRVFITGSNAKMLSSQMETTLGGRYFIKHITPYRFDEYLDALGIAKSGSAFYSTKSTGAIASAFDSFYTKGGFPESLKFAAPREYVENVYQKVLLGDVVARNNIRNVGALRSLMKKIAENVCNESSFSLLHGMLKGIGYNVGKSTVIDYVNVAKDSYLLIDVKNAVAKFVEREGNPKYYFSDNGLLSLFLTNKEPALLENEVAVALHDAYGENLHYLKSAQNGIDVDFYLPQEGMAVQVAHSLSESARPREIDNLLKLAAKDSAIRHFFIVTKEDEGELDVEGTTIHVVPAWKFLLRNLSGR